MVVSPKRESLRATQFEVEQRFWIIGAMFGVGFYLYAVNRTKVAVAIQRLIKKRAGR